MHHRIILDQGGFAPLAATVWRSREEGAGYALDLMRRYALPGGITVIVVALLALLAFGITHSGTNQSVESQVQAGHQPLAPDANLALPVLGANSRSETLASLRGKVVLVNFYAGWCDACQVEAPLIKRAEAELAAHGGTVLGITYDDSIADARSYLSQYHLAFPVLRDPSGTLAQAYGLTGVPQTFILNRQGRVEAELPNQLTSSWLNHALNRALGLPS
jgi:cytochrome c biogenesis protein CcmG/thiol:disulfide interchange protein DsbE